MDEEAGGSPPKRQRLLAFEIKEEYASDDNMTWEMDTEIKVEDTEEPDEREFDEGDGDYYDYDESSSDEAIIEVRPYKPKLEEYFKEVNEESSPVDPLDDSSSITPSTVGATATWSTTCNLENIPFSLQDGYSGEITGVEEIDYFNFFFSKQFLHEICINTNAHAEKYIALKEQYCKLKKWQLLTVPELRIFLGLLFHMGTINITRLTDYWKKDRLFSIPIFTEQMSRTRFLFILKCLRFTSEHHSQEPLSQVRNLIEYFNNKMAECYNPARELTMDANMVLRKGRLFNGNCTTVKRLPGTRLYHLSEPEGLVLKLYVDLKSGDIAEDNSQDKIVMKMIEGRKYNGHSVFLDKSYNSFNLAKKLLKTRTHCTGLLKRNSKDSPPEVNTKNLNSGENVSLFREGVHIGQFKKKHSVIYITTKYGNNIIPVKCFVGRGLDQVVKKPEALVEHDNYMFKEDREQLLMSYYPRERTHLRWHKKIGIHVFQLLLINSFKFYHKYSGRQTNLYDYRMAVLNTLLPAKKLFFDALFTGSNQVHRIRKNDIGKNNKARRKQCRVCYKKHNKRSDSCWTCSGCPDRPGLCFTCFDEYHELLQVKNEPEAE